MPPRYSMEGQGPMKGPHSHESRTECIARHVRRATRETRLSIEDFSADVLRVWQERTPPEVRCAHGADFRQEGTPYQLMAANGQKIRRWLNPEVSARPSVDVEECLVLALPEPFRSECLRDLAARMGGLFVRVEGQANLTLGAAGELMRQTGEALEALGPLMQDGQINARDRAADLERARAELLDVQAASAAVIAQIDHALDEKQRRATSPGLRVVGRE